MTALVTGATGFVGSAVARGLRAAGHEVRVTARRGSDRTNLDALDVDVVEADLLDEDSLARALRGCDALFHVAADYRLYVPDPTVMFRANVDGTRNVLRAAARAGVRRAVHTSSISTLGRTPDRSPADEQTPVSVDDMITPYKKSKFLGEEVARGFARDGPMEVVIVNPASPVGPGDVKPTPTGKMIADAASGRIPAFVDTGMNLVHVDDVAHGHLLAFERGRNAERYILGGQDVPLRDVLGMIAAIVGRRAPTIRLPHALVLPVAHVVERIARVTGSVPPFSVDAVRMSKSVEYFSSAKAARELGYTFRPARQALEDAVRWFEARGAVARPKP